MKSPYSKLLIELATANRNSVFNKGNTLWGCFTGVLHHIP